MKDYLAPLKTRKVGKVLIILLAVMLVVGIAAKFIASVDNKDIYSVKVDDVTVYLAEKDRKEVISDMKEAVSEGLDSASAAALALGLATEKSEADYAKSLYKHAIKKVDFDSGTIYDNVYAKMKPGDLLIRYQSAKDFHVVMVSNVEIELSDKGLADSKKSKVKVIDRQESETGNVLTFKKLAKKYHYQPVQLEDVK